MNFTAESGIEGLGDDVEVLFYRKGYLDIQRYEQLQVLKATHHASLQMMILFAVENGVATSLFSSPFGGIFTPESVLPEDISSFVTFIIDHFRRSGIVTLRIVQPSPLHDQFTPLPKEPFTVAFEDLNQHLDLKTGFDSQLHPMQIRKLRSAPKNNISCSVEDPSSLGEVHEFIADCRAQNGLKINISLQKLNGLFERFPDSYHIFSAFKDAERVASVVTCQVTPRVAYYYLPATKEEYKSFSPMVPLIKEIADYYRSRGISILDLGISSIQGTKQEGLYNFKERMGAALSYKPTYQLHL